MSKLANFWDLQEEKNTIKKKSSGVFWGDGVTLKWLTSHSAWAWSFEVSEQCSFWDGTFWFVYFISRSQVLGFSERSKDHFKLLSGQNCIHPQWVVFSVLAWNPLRKQNPVLFYLCFVTLSPSISWNTNGNIKHWDSFQMDAVVSVCQCTLFRKQR